MRLAFAALVLPFSLIAQAPEPWQAPLAERNWAQAEVLLRQTLQQGENAAALSGLATVYRATGRLTAADPLLERAVELEATVTRLEELARVKVALGQPESAETLYVRALELQADPRQSIRTLQRLAEVQASLKKFDQAERQANAAIRLRAADEPAELASDLALLARIYQTQRRDDSALLTWERVLSVQETAFGLDDARIAATLDSITTLRTRLNDGPGAEQALRRALAIREINRGPQHSEVAQTLDRLGEMLYAQDRFSDAEPIFRRALEIWKGLLPPDDSSIALNYDNLAVTLASQGKYAEAESLYLESLKLRDREDAASLRNLGVVRAAQGNYAAAEPLYRRAISTLEEPHNSLDAFPDLRGEYADIRGKLGRPKSKAPPIATKAK